MQEEKNIRTVEDWVKANNPWSIIHALRVPKTVSTKIIDVTGVGQSPLPKGRGLHREE